MNEKEKAEQQAQAEGKAQTQPGSSGMERQTEIGSSKKKLTTAEAKKVIQVCDQQEAQAYASRGYGGYINTEEITQLRKDRDAARAIVESDPKA